MPSSCVLVACTATTCTIPSWTHDRGGRQGITNCRTRLGTLTVKSKTKGSVDPAGSVKVETWEDLLNAGEKSKRVNPFKSSGYGGRYLKMNS